MSRQTVVPASPIFNEKTRTLFIPEVTGVFYQVRRGKTLHPGAHVIGSDVSVIGKPKSGYVIPYNIDKEWVFK